MPATYVLIFSLTVHLIDICGNVVECPDDAAERAAFYMHPLVQTTIYAHCRKAHETGVARRRHLPAAVEHKRREAAIDRAIGSVGCQLFCGLFLGPRSAVSQVTRTFPARKKTHQLKWCETPLDMCSPGIGRPIIDQRWNNKGGRKRKPIDSGE